LFGSTFQLTTYPRIVFERQKPPATKVAVLTTDLGLLSSEHLVGEAWPRRDAIPARPFAFTAFLNSWIKIGPPLF
jgi:hypothetical protein